MERGDAKNEKVVNGSLCSNSAFQRTMIKHMFGVWPRCLIIAAVYTCMCTIIVRSESEFRGGGDMGVAAENEGPPIPFGLRP
jgi:hypothetical protein